MLPQIDLLFERDPHTAAMNMALDEVLLSHGRRPLLRFYSWERPSVSFGYFERYESVATRFAGRDLVRRRTGGGVVEHGEDITYSLIVPCDLPRLSRDESYYEIHVRLAKALDACGIEASVADENATKTSNACFENPVRSDVMAQGRKIAGAAQHRSREGLLHQGSIRCGGVSANFPREFAVALSRSVAPSVLSPEILHAATDLAAKKYATDAWLRRV